ncbi:CCA tRNA nucleotidyltransferase [Thermofilum pendens]|uniref:CCA-adding enzyme n=1 Tax=Thermofilum pendens (strain DSM 2475 / Hrk 5) TaxID=368408 RepID=A1RX47_THEPD|nr:CCA tRNA nucleotidyltransferase [Thermofilum pendens]ABL77777.1 tRNA adenylyltransferase [Thermofilum pendens Hrk 5]
MTCRDPCVFKYPECLEEVLKKVKPSAEDKRALDLFAERLMAVVLEEANTRAGGEVSVELHGSYRHDTWLKGEADIDLFLLFPKKYSLEEMKEVARRVSEGSSARLGARVEERYASHPYYTLVFPNSVEVDVVPAYRVFSPSEIVTPVDRTQLHTAYLERKLSEKPWLKDEIRLLKRLLKNLGIYGAEQSLKGFSGYLAEILVVYYDGLEKLLREAARWRPGKVAVPDGKDLLERFKGQPLVVLDPVDSRRNAAASVSLDSLSKFILAAKMFSEDENILCCLLDPPEPRVDPDEELPRLLSSHNVIAVLARRHPELPGDALLGKMQRIGKSLEGYLAGLGFKVLRFKATLLSGTPALLVELESLTSPKTVLHVGPPVWHPNAGNFLRKWSTKSYGPFVSNGRLAVIRNVVSEEISEHVLSLLKSYAGFSWEVKDLRNILRDLSAEEKKEVYRWLSSVEPWTICAQYMS